MTLIQITKNYVVCPHCQKNSGGQIDHLMPGRKETTWGPWYCDECSNAFRGTVHADGAVTVEKVEPPDRYVKQFNLLCLPPQKKPVYFVTANRHFEGSTFEQRQFYYESHSCPTNWLRDIQMVSIEGDQDPHGLIKYLGSVDDQDDGAGDERGWDEVFPVVGATE